MASTLTARQQIRSDVMRECLRILVEPANAGYGDAQNLLDPIKNLAPFWRQYADLLADEILGKDG